MTHICVVKLTIIGSDNGLSPGRRQAIIWTNAGILLIGPLGTNFIEILVGIQTSSFKKMHLKVLSAKWRPFCLGLNVLTKKGWHYHIISLLQFVKSWYGNAFGIIGPLWGKPPVPGTSPHKWPVKWSFQVFLHVSLNKLLNTQMMEWPVIWDSQMLMWCKRPWWVDSPHKVSYIRILIMFHHRISSPHRRTDGIYFSWDFIQ